MRTHQLSKLFWFFLFVGGLFVLIIVGAVVALPAPGGTEPEGAEAIPAENVVGQAASGLIDGRFPDDNPTAADLAAGAAPAATFSYVTIAGAALQPRNSANDIVYASNGCSYMATGSSTGLLSVADFHIPDGSVIKYLRLYYYDTNAAAGVDGFLTRYAPGTATSDLISAGSSNAFTSGSGFVVSSEITETVNNASYSYVLIGWPDQASSTLRVCGLRVAYYAPPGWASFIPNVQRP